VHGLNIVGVIIPPGAAHTAGADVVGHYIAVVSEFLFANAADAVLSNDLPVQQLPHLPVGAQLAVSASVPGIVDAPDAQLTLMPFLWDCLPATAGEGAMDRAELTSTESHGVLWWAERPMMDFGGLGLKGKETRQQLGLTIPRAIWTEPWPFQESPKRPPLSKPQIFGTLFAHRGMRILWKLRRNRLGHADAGSLIRLILRDGLSLLI